MQNSPPSLKKKKEKKLKQKQREILEERLADLRVTEIMLHRTVDPFFSTYETYKSDSEKLMAVSKAVTLASNLSDILESLEEIFTILQEETYEYDRRMEEDNNES